MKRIVSIGLFLVSLNLFSQKRDSCLFVQFDIAPRWIWRGVSYSESPVLQPSFGFLGKKITAFVWGSNSISKGDYNEIDFVFEYKPIDQIKLGFTDYFGISDSIKLNQHYLNYNKKTTAHLFDIYSSIAPFKNIPLSFLWSTWFYGADKDIITKKQNYSTYFELRYDKQFHGIAFHAFTGGTPYKSFYYYKAGIVNIGLGVTKVHSLGNHATLPLKVEIIFNPSMQNLYLNAVIGLRFRGK